MGTKTISIMDDVYEKLISLKKSDESFSDQIRRLTEKGNIMELAGAWNDLNKSDAEKMKAKLLEKRKDRSRLDNN
ncbi:hypothetical protein HQ489_02630 [Candidatus Woesearchaeota archaeon]|nr:hypothetical protein [Candidatus Woesearchaeota archaeon]